MSLLSPLRIDKKGACLKRGEMEQRSIDSFIELLINTPLGEYAPDPDFGFVFSNMRFEMFDESEGVVHSSDIEQGKRSLYQKKISGTSKNINTFASELLDAIERYERRLSDISVSMSYVREQRKIFVTIKGVIKSTRDNYQYMTTIRVWS